MASNPDENNAQRRNNAPTGKRKSNNGTNFHRRSWHGANRSTGPIQRPVSLMIPQPASSLIRNSSETLDSGIRTVETSERLTSTNSSSSHTGQPTKPASFRINRKSGPYNGWQLYFPEIEYKDDLPLLRKIKAFEQHIKSQPLFYKLSDIRQKLHFSLQLPRLHSDSEFGRNYPDFASNLETSTNETLMCAGLAAHHIIQKDSQSIPSSQVVDEEAQTKLSLLPIRARIYGHTPIVNLSALRQAIYDCLISVRGTVVRVNPPSLRCSWIAYRCSKCKAEQAVRQMAQCVGPNSCKATGCMARSNFIMLQSSPYTQTEPYQTIRLQESVQSVKGQIPKTIEVDLAYDLVDLVCPGDDITVTGVMDLRTSERSGFNRAKQGAQAGLHKYFINAITVVSNKNTVAVRNLDFNERELEMVKSIGSEPNIFKILVHSLCPRIFGHEMVKAGLILSLFGASGNGANSTLSPGVGKRSEIHVLVVGDPGLGKSLLIQSCSNISPRGVFVCGNSATNAGLTVSIRNDKTSNGSLEAGALVLADQGVCCIDEFDKMSSNYQSLLQVMEQQSVSVAKAGVLCALPARTSILAAANPSSGHYDKSKTVAENLKIWPTLLSRFDMVFILLDRADAHLDDLLTKHVQALRANQNNQRIERQRTNNFTQAAPSYSFSCNQLTPGQSDQPLHERLKLSNPGEFQPLATDLFRKYILYARKFCFPTLSADATNELKNFYAEMRTTSRGIDSVPVTTRQLEALIRLTQARARIELASEATVEHARDVLAILRYTMIDVLSTDRGTLEMKRSINGSGMSHTTKVKKYLQLLQSQGKDIFTVPELKECAASLGFEIFFNSILDTLNIQGFLIKRGQNIYKFNT